MTVIPTTLARELIEPENEYADVLTFGVYVSDQN